jgi:predicted DNA-binding transcriptional regulator YafY
MIKTKAYQRLLDVALALTGAGRVGVTTPDLLERIGYHRDEAGKRALIRDLDDLRAVGLEIANAAGPGEDARYVLKPGDVRMRVEFSPAQRTALQVALAAASTSGTVALATKPLPIDLDRVREAVRAHCVMEFLYNGKQRHVDPIQYQWAGQDVVVMGRERDTGLVKTFSVRRIMDLRIAAPNTAQVPEDIQRPGLDPITWLVDPPLDALLTCPGFQDDVVAMLGGSIDGEQVRVTVTNRLVFLARLVELGSRVRLDSPDELRAELHALLQDAL